jgi:L-ascorbate metabolism protein UlaG (beta-lactamase superfamily)
MSFPSLTFLGQSGILLRLDDLLVCVDPYLTDSVAERHGELFRRRFPAPVLPGQLADLRWIFLTHAHEDHTDLATLLPLLQAAPQAMVAAPRECRELLTAAGVPRARMAQPGPGWTSLDRGLQVRAVPAAHLNLEVHETGEWRCVGYLFRWAEGLLYHAGDTVPHPAILQALENERAPGWALLPVNERNYFRAARGIIGNMSVREAFEFAEVIGARHLVPLHWDLFPGNGTSVEEIRLLHRQLAPRLELQLLTAGETLRLLTSPTE